MSREEARSRLGLDREAPLLLVMGGSMGFGRIQELTRELYMACMEGEQIGVICGTDRRMYRSLLQEFGEEKDIHILGYTDQVALWLDASDVVYTKPGGLTSTEALVRHVPIVHTAPIPGCETKNAEFFARRGMSVQAKTVREQVEAGMKLLYDPGMRGSMEQAQRENSFPRASLEIFHLMESLCRRERT